MIGRDEARRRAEVHLAEVKARSRIPLVLAGEREFADGWAFFYDSVQHQETGAFADLLGGNAPILVNRESGESFTTGTAHPVEYYTGEFSEQKRRLREDWPVGLDHRFLIC